MRKQIPTTNTNLDLINIHHFPSNGTHSGSNAVLHVFDDNEAVIKMIIKGRSPTMRHVSRTHRVALDWLFDRINLYPKIQIRYIDIKHQLEDILTKGNFTRDEWNQIQMMVAPLVRQTPSCTRATIRREVCRSTGTLQSAKSSGTSQIPSRSHLGQSILWRPKNATAARGCWRTRRGEHTRIRPNSSSSTWWSSSWWEESVELVRKGALAAKVKPRLKPAVTLISVSILVHERRWIDIETQRSNDHKCYEVSKSHHPIATT